eukprot:jgi/Mesvir1/18732/Mv01245-RA.1
MTGKTGGFDDGYQPHAGSSNSGPPPGDDSRGMGQQPQHGAPEPSPGYPVGQYGVPPQFSGGYPPGGGHPPPPGQYSAPPHYGAPPPQYNGAQQYPPQQPPYATPPPGYPQVPLPGGVQPGYPAGSPPVSQVMTPQHAGSPGVGGYPVAPVVTMTYQNAVPPGAPPGGMWGSDRYCGPVTWTAFICTWIWVCLPCPFCLCPCDDRQVYFAPDGRKYLPNGVLLSGTMSDAFAGM